MINSVQSGSNSLVVGDLSVFDGNIKVDSAKQVLNDITNRVKITRKHGILKYETYRMRTDFPDKSRASIASLLRAMMEKDLVRTAKPLKLQNLEETSRIS